MSGDTEHYPGAIPKPPGTKEFTVRAVIAGVIVAVIMGVSYPYMVLKIGFGPNVSVVAAFLGFLALGLFFRNYNRWENNIVQTAGTSAAQTAFMCVLLAAFDFLKASKTIEFDFSPTPLQSFFWLTSAGLLGVLLAVPMRQHFVVDEKLTYADGVAAAETLIVLDSRGGASKNAVRALAAGAVLSGIVFLLQQPKPFNHFIPDPLIPTMFGLTLATMGMGVTTGLLSLGSGALVGMRINISMLIGAVLAWIIAPRFLIAEGILPATATRNDVLRWVMWPATGMLVAGGLTALALRWRILVKTFKNLSGKSIRSDEFPLRYVWIGAGLSAVALVAFQRISMGIPIYLTVLAILISIPLMLVGLRVLGETNWGPISSLSNLVQTIFAGIAPGNVTVNLVASGTTGTIASDSEAIMQDYKAGHIIGSSPKYLTYAQLFAVPIGAAAVSWMYPVLKEIYGVGGSGGLSAPTAVRWAGFAEFVSTGLANLPRGTMTALLIFAILGVIITLLEERWRKYVPSPTGVGIAMMVPGAVIVTMFIGGLMDWIWRRTDPKSNEAMSTPLASGLIAGEAIVAVLYSILSFAGVF